MTASHAAYSNSQRTPALKVQENNAPTDVPSNSTTHSPHKTKFQPLRDLFFIVLAEVQGTIKSNVSMPLGDALADLNLMSVAKSLVKEIANWCAFTSTWTRLQKANALG